MNWAPVESAFEAQAIADFGEVADLVVRPGAEGNIYNNKNIQGAFKHQTILRTPASSFRWIFEEPVWGRTLCGKKQKPCL